MLLETVSVIPGEANVAAVPLAATALVHVEFVYSFTVEPASALPMIFGALLFAGEAGLVLVSVGCAGAVESSTYVTELDEQAETLPAASVAVASKLVVESSATDTDNPGDANAAAVPLPWIPFPQFEFLYKFTVEPASALPMILGELLFAGDAGLELDTVGGAGAFESST